MQLTTRPDAVRPQPHVGAVVHVSDSVAKTRGVHGGPTW